MQFDTLIKVLGPRQMALLTLQLAIVLGLGAITYFYLVPQTTQQVNTLQQARSYVMSKKSEIQTMRQQYADIQTFLREYQILEKQNFFIEQDRINARRVLDEIIQKNGLIRARYEIQRAGFAFADDRARAASDAPPPPPLGTTEEEKPPEDFVLISSPIEISFEAYDDVQVYGFLMSLQNQYPGIVAITGLQIERVRDFDADVYAQVGSGVPVTLVQGRIELNWFSMVPRSTVSVSQMGN